MYVKMHELSLEFLKRREIRLYEAVETVSRQKGNA